MEFNTQLSSQIELIENIKKDSQLLGNITDTIELLNKTISKNLPILIFGNGGSASDALHITGELVGRFLLERKPINAICLNSNVSVLTAWANDYDFDTVFERQIEAHAISGGVCWGISTSGNSKNIVKAFKVAQNLEMKTIGLTGKGGGMMKKYSDILIDVPSKSTPRIQELHLPIYHYICEKVEQYKSLK